MIARMMIDIIPIIIPVIVVGVSSWFRNNHEVIVAVIRASVDAVITSGTGIVFRA